MVSVKSQEEVMMEAKGLNPGYRQANCYCLFYAKGKYIGGLPYIWVIIGITITLGVIHIYTYIYIGKFIRFVNPKRKKWTINNSGTCSPRRSRKWF